MHKNLSGTEFWLEKMARIAAAGWLEIVASRADAYLSQLADDQMQLFDLLLWYCGSVDVMLRQLAAKWTHIRATKAADVPSSQDLLKLYIQTLAQQRYRESAPSQMQLGEWLSIRPTGIADAEGKNDSTIILALLPPDMPNVEFNHLALLAQELAERRVYFHLVVEQTTALHFRNLRTQTLTWSKTELQAIIDARIASASAPGGPQTFADLTDDLSLGDTNPYTYLWDVAQGSLHRALKYCRVAVEIHQNSGAPGGFTEETLMSARDAVNRDKS